MVSWISTSLILSNPLLISQSNNPDDTTENHSDSMNRLVTQSAPKQSPETGDSVYGNRSCSYRQNTSKELSNGRLGVDPWAVSSTCVDDPGISVEEAVAAALSQSTSFTADCPQWIPPDGPVEPIQKVSSCPATHTSVVTTQLMGTMSDTPLPALSERDEFKRSGSATVVTRPTCLTSEGGKHGGKSRQHSRRYHSENAAAEQHPLYSPHRQRTFSELADWQATPVGDVAEAVDGMQPRGSSSSGRPRSISRKQRRHVLVAGGGGGGGGEPLSHAEAEYLRAQRRSEAIAWCK